MPDYYAYEYYAFNNTGSYQLYGIYLGSIGTIFSCSISPTNVADVTFLYDRFINTFVKNYYNDDADHFSKYFNDNSVMSFDTKYNGNSIKIVDEVDYWGGDAPDLATYHMEASSFVVPYFEGEGFSKNDKITGEFGINVWTGLDSLK